MMFDSLVVKAKGDKSYTTCYAYNPHCLNEHAPTLNKLRMQQSGVCTDQPVSYCWLFQFPPDKWSTQYSNENRWLVPG